MKAYTDLVQSKKLAEILPLESADIILTLEGNSELTSYPIMRNYSEFYNYLRIFELEDEYIKRTYIPAWSLSALLDILAKEIHNIDEDGYVVLSSYKGNWWNISPINCISEEINESNNPIDAAFELICWLKENGKI